MSERDEDEGEDGYGLKVFDEMSKRESLRDFKGKKNMEKVGKDWGRKKNNKKEKWDGSWKGEMKSNGVLILKAYYKV